MLKRAPAGGGRRARITIRVDFGERGALGPGKIALLEAIARHSSISAAGRSLGMSYRRAWLLVEALNDAFREPLVVTHTGGARGGGASLSPLGAQIVHRYRAMEQLASASAEAEIAAIENALAPRASPEPRSTADRPTSATKR